MLITMTDGTKYEAHNIAWMKAKPLPDGDWELEIHPVPHSRLEPAGAMFAEVPVPHSEAKRIARVAPHLFAPGCAKYIDGYRKPVPPPSARQLAELDANERIFGRG